MVSLHGEDISANLMFSRLHGENIKLSSCGSEAEWKRDNHNGTCVTNRTIDHNESVSLKVGGSGHFLLGLVYDVPNIGSQPDADPTEWLDSLHWKYFRNRKSESTITISRSSDHYQISWTYTDDVITKDKLTEVKSLYVFLCVYFGDLEMYIETDSNLGIAFDNRHGSNIRLSHQQQRVSLHHYNPFAVCCVGDPLLPEKRLKIVLCPVEDANWRHCHIFLSNVRPYDIGLSTLQSITSNGKISAEFVPFGSKIEKKSSVSIAISKSGMIASKINRNYRKDILREIDITQPIYVYIEVLRMRALLKSPSTRDSEDLQYLLVKSITPRPMPFDDSGERINFDFSEPPAFAHINTTEDFNASDRSTNAEGIVCNQITEVKTIAHPDNSRTYGQNTDSNMVSEEINPNEQTSRKYCDDTKTKNLQETVPKIIQETIPPRIHDLPEPNSFSSPRCTHHTPSQVPEPFRLRIPHSKEPFPPQVQTSQALFPLQVHHSQEPIPSSVPNPQMLFRSRVHHLPEPIPSSVSNPQLLFQPRADHSHKHISPSVPNPQVLFPSRIHHSQELIPPLVPNPQVLFPPQVHHSQEPIPPSVPNPQVLFPPQVHHSQEPIPPLVPNPQVLFPPRVIHSQEPVPPSVQISQLLLPLQVPHLKEHIPLRIHNSQDAFTITDGTVREPILPQTHYTNEPIIAAPDHGSRKPLHSNVCTIIQSHFVEMMNKMEPDSIATILYNDGIISEKENGQYKELSTKSKRCRFVLLILQSRLTSVNQFSDILTRTSQSAYWIL